MPKDFMCISLCVLVYVYDRVKHNRRVFFNAIVRYVLKKKRIAIRIFSSFCCCILIEKKVEEFFP